MIDISTLGDTILCVVSHADDVAMNFAGLIMELIERHGARVIVVVITDSAGDNGTNQSHIRRREELLACELIGVTDVRFLGYPDGHSAGHLPQIKGDLAEIIRKERPTAILSFDPANGLTGHEDHRLGAGCVEDAAQQAEHPVPIVRAAITGEWRRTVMPELRRRAKAIYDEVALPATPDSQLALDIHLDEHQLQRKVAAVLVHESQIHPLLGQLAPLGGLDWLVSHWFQREAFTIKNGG